MDTQKRLKEKALLEKALLTLDDIIAVADEAYPDGLIKQASDEGKCGDGLAEFIAREIDGTFDYRISPADVFINAIKALTVARNELNEVIEALMTGYKIMDTPYEHIIQEFATRKRGTCKSIDDLLLKRIKPEDLPLFINYPWNEDMKQDYIDKLKG